jgi:hypothetical protein
MPKRILNGGSTEPLPPEVITNEPATLDPHARARRKTAVLWFVAVTFGTMALLSLPISRLIQSGFGKGVLHHALGPVERLIRPNSGWEPPPASALPPSAQVELAGPVLQPNLFPSIESPISSTGPAPVQPSHVHSITVSAPDRPSRAGSDARPASRGRDHRPRREHEHHPHRPRRQ